MATTRKTRGPVLGQYVVDLKHLGDVPLSKVLGDVGTPIMLGTLQERLWKFLQKESALQPGGMMAELRAKRLLARRNRRSPRG